MTPLESHIRDHLAAHLGLIEPGLQLVEKEYAVGNPNGAGGRIDILARDRLGNLVVIEIKRSDQAARTALHEVVKYAALLQGQKGIAADRLRALVVSTEWHELRTPFSELVHASPHSLQGFALELDARGDPCRVTPIVPLPRSEGLTFPTEFPWLTFASAADRELARTKIVEILEAVGIRHAALVAFDSIDPGLVVYPYSLLMALFPMSGSEARAILDQQRFPLTLLPDFGPLQEHREDDHTLQSAVQESLESEILCVDGIRDVHMAESRHLIAERKWWQIESIVRLGPQLKDARLMSDNDLVERLSGVDGSSDVYLLRAVASSSKAQFEALSTSLDQLLSRYGWITAAGATLDRAARRSDATIVAHAYAPSNLLKHFAAFLRSGDASYLPAFDITSAASSYVEQLSGFLAWDGTTPPPSPDAVLPDKGTGGNILRLVVEDPDASRALVEGYGFTFPWIRVIDGGGVESSSRFVPISDWIRRHPEAAAALSRRLGPILV